MPRRIRGVRVLGRFSPPPPFLVSLVEKCSIGEDPRFHFHTESSGGFMPAYSNATPPLALFPGDVGFSFNAESFPADGTAGSQFAVPEPAGLPDQGHTVRWQTIFGTAPTAINIRLQGAMADVDTEFMDIDTSTVTTGEARTVIGVRARFLRVKKVTSTGGTSLTAKILP